MVHNEHSDQRDRTDRLSLLAEVAQLVSTTPHLDDLLGEAARTVHEAVPFLDLTIGLLEPSSGDLVLRARVGRYEQFPSGYRVSRGLGI